MSVPGTAYRLHIRQRDGREEAADAEAAREALIRLGSELTLVRELARSENDLTRREVR